ncbi:polyprenyl synthetase family protein [Scopulibacillus cellulosilyticus]|uniref:Polyprenyl synthetase family protein n=1 Tax=Scopulibacillus cellulosilyticus TaxID=2665665 RepID=A0ABW2Q2F2_9BACL
MNNEINQYLKEKKQLIDISLPEYITKLRAPEILKKSMVYSLKAGGKRLRPILLMASIEALGHDGQKGIETACALEMIHTYSLIHDDLPAMDNDDLRRGQPTNHKVYGDATAILAGDALLTYAFECIAGIDHPDIDNDMKMALIQKLANAAGPEGMVGGQQDDLTAEGKSLTIQELQSIHLRKTGRLLCFAVEAGAILGQANEQQAENLSDFAKHLGIAFQIKDDILDIIGDEITLGKPVGSDVTNNKNTYPKLLTLEGAKEKMNKHADAALHYLKAANVDSYRLQQLMGYVLDRNH